MGQRVIDRAEWADYVGAFSRRHDGWLISLAVEEASNARRHVVRDVPLSVASSPSWTTTSVR